MNEPRDETQHDPDEHWGQEQEWDEVVDVICVGSTPGVLAYLMACEANDLEVLHVAAPSEFDHETSAYLAAMTEGLDARPDESEPVVIRAVPAPLRMDTRGRPDTLEPFIGEQLRIWSAHCLASPFGVMFTEVPDVFTRMRTDAGETIVAAMIPEVVENDCATETFAGLLYEYKRLSGALVDGESGPRKVRAEAGLALPIGPCGQWPASAQSLGLVSRPAGRFARLEAVLPESGGHD